MPQSNAMPASGGLFNAPDTPKESDFRFQPGAVFPGDPNYVIVDKNDNKRVKLARYIGRGAVGLVYRTRYKDQIDRAIKFLVPDENGDEQARLSFQEQANKFKSEIGLLAKITHTNLCKIVDFATYTYGEKSCPYYVMDYVDGMRFDKYWASCSAADFLTVLQQVVDALAYLHAQNHFHMDVKEENIFIQKLRNAAPHAVLLDLGGAKNANFDGKLPPRDTTIFVSTAKATRPWRVPSLGKSIPYQQIHEWSTDVDLYAVGAMMRRALANESLQTTLSRDLTPSGLTAVRWVIDNLTKGNSEVDVKNRYYRTALQLGADLQRLRPNYMWPLGLPELSVVVGPHSIQLPRERVGLTADLMRIVNHPMMQRLRNIPQLEYVHLVYPGARHSRFEHSLTAFQLARSFLSKLLQFPDFRMIVGPEHVQAALLLALLHDVGHYPLSHMFEDFTPEGQSESEYRDGAIPSDEALFASIVCPHSEGRSTQRVDPIAESIAKKLNEVTGESWAGRQLQDELRSLFPASCELLRYLLHPPRALKTTTSALPRGFASRDRDVEGAIRMLHGIISSAIDIDKISYLTADSSATGVKFGHGIDLDGLIEALIPPKTRDERIGGIAIREDGLQAAEAVVMARFWMISRVYWHRLNRAIMAMHKFVIADLIDNSHFSFTKYFEDTLFMTQTEATQYLHKEYRRAHRSGQPVKEPLLGILGAGRQVYKRLLTISNGPAVVDKELYRKIGEEKAFGVKNVGEMIRRKLVDDYPTYGAVFGDILADIPLRRRDLLGAGVLVYLDRRPDEGLDLYGGEKAASPTLQHLTDDFEQSVKKCRIFFHPSLMQRIIDDGRLEEIRDWTRGTLQEHYNVSG